MPLAKFPTNIPLWALHHGIRLLADRHLNGRLAVLIYHRVRSDTDPLTPYDMKAEQFDWEMRLLRNYFNVLPLGDALAAMANGTLPERAVSITFDDGYTDQVKVALPILRKYGHHATFFIPTGYLSGGCMWNDLVIETIRYHNGSELDLSALNLAHYSTVSVPDKRETIAHLVMSIKHFHPEKRMHALKYLKTLIGFDVATDLMMGEDMVKLLVDAGMEVGSHTMMHPILTSVTDEEASNEITESKRILEGITGRPVRYFAYPNGKPYEDYMPEHMEIVRQAGFEAAFSTAKGVATSESDICQLPRFTPWDDRADRFLLRLMGNYTETEPLIV